VRPLPAKCEAETGSIRLAYKYLLRGYDKEERDERLLFSFSLKIMRKEGGGKKKMRSREEKGVRLFPH
jgi:hypothetical protein